LTLSEALSSVIPATSRFFVLVGGVARTVSSAAVNISNNTVSLTLGSAVTAGQAVTLAYSDATSGNETTGIIEDVPGNDLASFSARTVTNSTVAPTYVITPSSISINEGLTLATTATTTNVAAGITLYWSASGTGINAADFSAGALTGSGIVGTDGKFSFSHALASDLTTEGDESLQIKLFSDAARTVQLGSTATLTVADISISIPTYRISTPSGREKNEGSTITTTVDTTNVTAGTTLYYSLSGTDITSADLSTGTINGSGVVDINGTFTFSYGIANDNITEGNETLEIKLFTDAERSQQVGTTSGIIWDTSTTLKQSEAPFNSLIKLDDTSCPSDLKATREGALYSTAGASLSLNGFSNRKVDALVQKQNKAGQTVWKEYLGGNENDFPRALSIGVDDAIYVASLVSSTGNAMGGYISLSVGKLSSDGDKVWLCAVNADNVSTGNFRSLDAIAAAVDGSTFLAGTIRTSGNNDVFLVKLTSDGSKSWENILNFGNDDYIFDLAGDSDGSVFVFGRTNGNLKGEVNNGGTDTFIAKHDSAGALIWTHLIGGKGEDFGMSGIISSDGFLYVAGDTGGVIDNQVSNGQTDIFLSKWDRDGSKIWSKLIGTGGMDDCPDLSAGPNGSIFITGQTEGSINGQENNSSERRRGFISEYDKDGNELWTKISDIYSKISYGGGYLYAQATPAGLAYARIAPTVTDLSVNGSTITLTLSDALSSVIPATSRFFVLVGGIARTVSSAAVNISNNTVSLTLGSAVTAGQAVTLTYSDATSGNDTTGIIEDVTGNDLASFSARTVTNSTVAPTYVITPSASASTKD